MSAYMPVKHNWSLGALLPSRWGFSRSSRLLSISIFTAAAIVLTLFSLFRFGTVRIEELPAATSGAAVSLGANLSRDHGFIVVQGEASNRGHKVLRNLEATVELFDRNGSLRGVESALVDNPTVGVHEESAFVVRMPDPGDVRSFRVRFHSVEATGVH